MFATFESETDYFGSRAQQVMLNFRVRDLDAMLAQLRLKGADVAEETRIQTRTHKGAARMATSEALFAGSLIDDSPGGGL